jgi:hypothetical protein
VLLTFTYEFLSIESCSQSPPQHFRRRNHFTLIVSPPYSRKTRRHHSSEADTICKSPAHHYRLIQLTYVVQNSTSKPPTEMSLVVLKVFIDKITLPSLFTHDTLTIPPKQPHRTLANFSPTFPVHCHLAITPTEHHFIFRTDRVKSTTSGLIWDSQNHVGVDTIRTGT